MATGIPIIGIHIRTGTCTWQNTKTITSAVTKRKNVRVKDNLTNIHDRIRASNLLIIDELTGLSWDWTPV